MYKKDDVKKFTNDCIKEKEINGLLVLDDTIKQAMKESASRGKFSTSLRYTTLSFNGVDVKSYYFYNYLLKLKNEGFKIKTKQYINVRTNVIYKELIISWED